MQEVLSRTKDSEAPSPGTQFYELRLDDCELCFADSDFAAQAGFRVRQARAYWNDVQQGIEWDIPELWVFENLHEAEAQYEKQRLALVEEGFIYSDMDW